MPLLSRRWLDSESNSSMTHSSATKVAMVTPPTTHPGRFFDSGAGVAGSPGRVLGDQLSLLAVSSRYRPFQCVSGISQATGVRPGRQILPTRAGNDER